MRFITSPIETNTYLVVNENKAFVVDPGGDADKIFVAANECGAQIEAILLTHAHFDHIAGVADLKSLAESKGGSVHIFMHKNDADKIKSFKNLAFSVGESVKPFEPDILLCGGETLCVAGIPIKVLHTPGHSSGGVCYIAADKIFVGDTVFFTSYGRTDFYDGDFKTLKNSIINKLFRLRGNYTLLTGHGDPTTLEFERKNNAINFDGKD
jgi:glyoxylase-like metal-dependent hydrolase (beta-lactamase superfamily II)